VHIDKKKKKKKKKIKKKKKKKKKKKSSFAGLFKRHLAIKLLKKNTVYPKRFQSDAYSAYRGD